MEHLLAAVSSWIEAVISSGGYIGIVLLMAIESACIPLPSEVIMPFAGALTSLRIAHEHSHAPLSLPMVALAGAIGCALGSAIAYAAGATGGREFIFKYGRYILLRRRDVERAELWFQRRGQVTVFLARLLPIVRTFISLPAGIAKMPFGSFLALSFIGSLPWCYALGWLGVKVGDNIEVLKKYFHGADAIIVVACVALFAIWLRHHLRPDEPETK